ncbi:MAG: S4 domain-containing protein, partial [Candidatus Magasanikbacteria bacterium]
KPEVIEEIHPSNNSIITVLVEAGFAKTNSDARRSIEQGGIKVNDEKVSSHDLEVKSGDIVQKGKRFFVKIK